MPPGLAARAVLAIVVVRVRATAVAAVPVAATVVVAVVADAVSLPGKTLASRVAIFACEGGVAALATFAHRVLGKVAAAVATIPVTTAVIVLHACTCMRAGEQTQKQGRTPHHQARVVKFNANKC